MTLQKEKKIHCFSFKFYQTQSWFGFMCQSVTSDDLLNTNGPNNDE